MSNTRDWFQVRIERLTELSNHLKYLLANKETSAESKERLLKELTVETEVYQMVKQVERDNASLKEITTKLAGLTK